MRALDASPSAWLQERNMPARRFAGAGRGSQEDGGVWVLYFGCLGVVLSDVWVFCVAVFRFLPRFAASDLIRLSFSAACGVVCGVFSSGNRCQPGPPSATGWRGGVGDVARCGVWGCRGRKDGGVIFV